VSRAPPVIRTEVVRRLLSALAACLLALCGLPLSAGITMAEVESGVQASIPDLRGVVRPGINLASVGPGNGDTDIQAGEDGHGTAMAAMIAGQGRGTGTVGIAPRVYVGRDGRFTTTGAGTSFAAALIAGRRRSSGPGTRTCPGTRWTSG
jgi:hypothetical protein